MLKTFMSHWLIICVDHVFFFHFHPRSSEKRFKINNRTVENKRTGEKFGPKKIIVQ